MKQRLTNETKQDTEAQAEQVSQKRAEQRLEFKSAEETIRFDAARTAVPPGLRERVLREAEGERARLPWWRRWFR